MNKPSESSFKANPTKVTKNLSARQIAVRILTRVEKENAYANLLLRSQLAQLSDPRERHFASAVVNGVLKNRMLIDHALRQHLSKPMSSLPHEARAVLRTGAYQLLFMDRVPQPVAIYESVELMKHFHGAYAPLVNSVLRKTAENGWTIKWPDPVREPIRFLSVKHSHPEWLVKRWLQRYGLQETQAMLEANNQASPTCIRVNALKTSKEDLIENLEKQGVIVNPSSKLPDALFIEDFGALELLESFQAGHFTVQDESSQLAAYLLGAQPGERILDVCSAPGGKSTYLAERMEDQGEIVSGDIFPQKIAQVEELAARLGIHIIRPLITDARDLEKVEGFFDRVLVDAPCSGLGVIRRRADLRWQKREDEIGKLPALQLEILLRAADKVLPGGTLLYSTCTTEPEENYEVVKAFRKARADFVTVDLSKEVPFSVTEKRDLQQLQKGLWQILPHQHQMDGFFIAKFQKTASS